MVKETYRHLAIDDCLPVRTCWISVYCYIRPTGYNRRLSQRAEDTRLKIQSCVIGLRRVFSFQLSDIEKFCGCAIAAC
jgi:hypothetical protein